MILLKKDIGIITVITMLLIFVTAYSHAQELPPRPMKVTTFQNLSMGSFINGNSGGTVTITPEGSRTSTGDIYLVNMNSPFYPAIFEVEALPGNIIHIQLPVYATLVGPGGKITTLEINSSLPVSPFINSINPPHRTQVRVGGTLTVESPLGTPAGDYHGTFSVTFIQE
jgi:hypothetical protein